MDKNIEPDVSNFGDNSDDDDAWLKDFEDDIAEVCGESTLAAEVVSTPSHKATQTTLSRNQIAHTESGATMADEVLVSKLKSLQESLQASEAQVEALKSERRRLIAELDCQRTPIEQQKHNNEDAATHEPTELPLSAITQTDSVTHSNHKVKRNTSNQDHNDLQQRESALAEKAAALKIMLQQLKIQQTVQANSVKQSNAKLLKQRSQVLHRQQQLERREKALAESLQHIARRERTLKMLEDRSLSQTAVLKRLLEQFSSATSVKTGHSANEKTAESVCKDTVPESKPPDVQSTCSALLDDEGRPTLRLSRNSPAFVRRATFAKRR